MEEKNYLTWILDWPEREKEELRAAMTKEEWKKWFDLHWDDKYRWNIDFVHSLGEKCDSVGWSCLDLNKQDALEKLEKIRDFCKEKDCRARGGYSRRFEGLESNWYAIAAPEPKEGKWTSTDGEYENGETERLYCLKAYCNHGNILEFCGNWMVSEKFREVCLRRQIPGLTFCWVPDQGKYEAEQYFYLQSNRQISRVACDRFLRYSYCDAPEHRFNAGRTAQELEVKMTGQSHVKPTDSNFLHRLDVFGGYLPMLPEFFHDLSVFLPTWYPESEMPEDGFLQVTCKRDGYYFDELLVHRDTAALLIEEGVLSPKLLFGVPLYGEVPDGYWEEQTVIKPRLKATFCDEMLARYEALKKTKRPQHKATEKQALRILRKARSQSKEDYGKGMKRILAPTLEGTPYAPLAPYYLTANGGDLSDEYAFLSYEDAQKATAEFFADMAKEELLEEAPRGIIFACCADGDRVLLHPEGTVSRYSHEIPKTLEDWQTLAQFFVDCVEVDWDN